MAHRFCALISIVTMVLVWACSGAPKSTGGTEPVPPVTGDDGSAQPAADGVGAGGLISEPTIWLSADPVAEDCERHLEAARQIRDELVATTGSRTLENTLEPLNKMYIHLSRLTGPAEVFANFSTDPKVREAADKCMQQTMGFIAKLKLDRPVYDALAAVDPSGFDQPTARFLQHELRDYRRAGVDKDDATRQKLQELNAEIVKTSLAFERNIRESKRHVELGKKALKGLPEDFIAKHPPNKKGKVKITMAYPDFRPMVRYAESEAARKAVMLKFLSRAYPENDASLRKLLALRHEYANLLGSSHWADYNAGDKMARDEKTIAAFIEELAQAIRPKMMAELADLLKIKKKANRKAKKIRMWDNSFYVGKVQKERFKVDAQQVRQYFEYSRVIAGVLEISAALYGVTFEKDEKATVWHPSVEVYNMLENGRVIAKLYLDMHPREGKFSHAGVFNLYPGITGIQLPSALIGANFPAPSPDAPALLEHANVVTLFHEFGHLLHALFAGRHQWVPQSGISCEWDFVETPSMLYQEWAWDYSVLKTFARHHQTDEVIPEELVAKMAEADRFGKAVFYMRQLFLTALSLQLHNQPAEPIDFIELTEQLHQKYSPFPFEKGAYLHANFVHLKGYSSAYYTYLWSGVIAKDLFSRFQQAGLMDRAVAREFRNAVLDQGGAMDAAEMVKRFLGREYQFDAFKKSLD